MRGKKVVATSGPMRWRVELTFVEDVLGSAPLDRAVYSEFIASKRSDLNGGDEIESINEDKGKTGFHKDGEGNPILYDYVLKGFFKDACGMLKRVGDSESGEISAFKKIIDGLVFVLPRRIPITMSGPMDVLERPLRAQTAQGERVALAASECIPAGSGIKFEIAVLESGVVTESVLREWLDYGALRGLGQWRNGGYGRFEYSMERA